MGIFYISCKSSSFWCYVVYSCCYIFLVQSVCSSQYIPQAGLFSSHLLQKIKEKLENKIKSTKILLCGFSFAQSIML